MACVLACVQSGSCPGGASFVLAATLPAEHQAQQPQPHPVRPTHALQVTQPGYQAFLRYMCPRWESAAVGGGPVPPGDDLSACPRPVLGTYDDHDYVSRLGIESFEIDLGGKGGEDAGKRWCGC